MCIRDSFEGIQIVFQLAVVGLDKFGVAQGYLTGAGQTDLLARPLKKRQTYLLLQFLNVSRNGWLSNEKLGGSFGNCLLYTSRCV